MRSAAVVLFMLIFLLPRVKNVSVPVNNEEEYSYDDFDDYQVTYPLLCRNGAVVRIEKMWF